MDSRDNKPGPPILTTVGDAEERCPHCGSRSVDLRDSNNGVEEFSCNDCRKEFELTKEEVVSACWWTDADGREHQRLNRDWLVREHAKDLLDAAQRIAAHLRGSLEAGDITFLTDVAPVLWGDIEVIDSIASAIEKGEMEL